MKTQIKKVRVADNGVGLFITLTKSAQLNLNGIHTNKWYISTGRLMAAMYAFNVFDEKTIKLKAIHASPQGIHFELVEFSVDRGVQGAAVGWSASWDLIGEALFVDQYVPYTQEPREVEMLNDN